MAKGAVTTDSTYAERGEARIRVTANADEGRYYTRLARVGEQESKGGRPK